MSTEQTETPQWGAPPPPVQPGRRWSAKRIVVAVAIAVGIAAAGGVAIYAASGSTAADQGGPRGGAGGQVLVGGPMGGMSGSGHGEFQTGEVTELTDDSITAKSKDGFTKTYVIDDGTELSSSVVKGDEVTIIATTEGSTTTAESVMEMGAMPQQRRDGNGGPPNGDPKDDDGN